AAARGRAPRRSNSVKAVRSCGSWSLSARAAGASDGQPSAPPRAAAAAVAPLSLAGGAAGALVGEPERPPAVGRGGPVAGHLQRERLGHAVREPAGWELVRAAPPPQPEGKPRGPPGGTL